MTIMKRSKWYFIVYLWTGVYDLISWLFLLLMCAGWGTKLQWQWGVWFEWKKDSWPVRTWFKNWGGTCIGHGGWLSPGLLGGPGIDTKTEFHEHTHSEQFEAITILGFLMALSIVARFYIAGYPIAWPDWIMVFCIWNLSFPVYVLCSMFVAKLRGEDPYKGSSLEESAYALADEWERKKQGDVPRGHFK